MIGPTCIWHFDTIIAEARHISIHYGLTGSSARSLCTESPQRNNRQSLKAIIARFWNVREQRSYKIKSDKSNAVDDKGT